jgi:hypothetical protein
VHDFTSKSGERNYSYLPVEARARDLLPPLNAEEHGIDTTEEGFVTPLTYGNRPASVPKGDAGQILICIAPTNDQESIATELLEQYLTLTSANLRGRHLMRSRRVDFARADTKGRAKIIFKPDGAGTDAHGISMSAQQAFLAPLIAAGKLPMKVMGFEVHASSRTEAAALLKELQPFLALHAGAFWISGGGIDAPAIDETRRQTEMFFENLAVM